MILFDHALSLGQEVRVMRGRNISSVTLLFHVNRWLTFIYALTGILFLVNWNVLPVSSTISALSDVCDILLYVVWAIFSAIRVYALSRGQWLLALCVFALSFVPAATNVYNRVTTEIVVVTVPFVGLTCTDVSKLSEDANIHFIIATRVCVMVSDIVVLLVTWMQTWTTRRAADRANIDSPIATMLLRDGDALLALNVLQIVGFITNVFVYAVQVFITPLSAIIISHFLMNLRDAGTMPHDYTVQSEDLSFVQRVDGQSQPQVSDIGFNRFVGNMGAELEHSFMRSEEIFDVDI
ncbi:hypothetical protein CERSUDRAFT_64576 [Gelatoporia subvermispora B]|uniref:DUF6533 domain-containing protein n=1 Tax=Ceriporiopsis subvermispora (strain B) TaxID=914234 RepID=M2PPA9_CERS8|nr:hypothetical protein CERSUDRAFT_64576 [Gelatoporia subvermispora B]